MKKSPFFLFIGLSACVSSKYQLVDDPVVLQVSFVDQKWDGNAVPKDEVCSRGGANGNSPRLKVENIPAGANAVVVEFNDRSYAPLATGGGHGAIWVPVTSTSVIVPSVPTESSTMPEGVNIEHKHRGHGSGIGGGVYLAPCSRGRGNTYFADVKAVYKPDSDQQQGQLLGQGRITLGRY